MGRGAVIWPVVDEGVPKLDGPSASPGFQPDLHRKSEPFPIFIATEPRVSVRVAAYVDGKPEADDEADEEDTERVDERWFP